MPVRTRKTKSGYTNSTPGGVKGRGMTKRNAMRQKRLINAVEHGFKPTGKPAEDIKRRVMERVD
jgi:hypothetical protein